MVETNRFVPEPASSEQECKAMVDVLARVGDKWTIMIVGALSDAYRQYLATHANADLERSYGGRACESRRVPHDPATR
jgi:DNA-binding HxlR family transcriptional regulator